MIYEYDIVEQTIRSNYWDKDLFGGQVLTINGNYMGIGYCLSLCFFYNLPCRDAAGILSIYNTPTLQNTQPSKESARSIQPLKIVKNLVTAITSVDINNDNSILVYASNDKADSIRAVHLNSLTTFSNWPENKERFGTIDCLSLSGDNRILIWRM